MASLSSFQEHEERIRSLFTPLRSDEEKYELILKLGRDLPPLSSEKKTPQTRVPGCQSNMFLFAFKEGSETKDEELLRLSVDADALLSKGLGAIMLLLYDQLTPKEVFMHPPTIFEEISLLKLLSPTRSQGFSSLHKKIQFYAISFLAEE